MNRSTPPFSTIPGCYRGWPKITNGRDVTNPTIVTVKVATISII